MKIYHKIILISSSIFAAILIITSIIIFKGFSESSRNIFYQELSRTAEVSALFYLEEDELSRNNYAPIREAFFDLSRNEIISIYDEKGNIFYDTQPQDIVSLPLLARIREKKKDNFQIGNNFYHGLFYEDNQGEFVIIVGSENQHFQNQQENLVLILLIAFFLGMSILIVITNRLSRLVYRPVTNVIKQVNSLNLHKKSLILEYPRTKDELEELFRAFNSLLGEIESTYEIQKNFIDHASHELKTPLAGLINDLEIAMHKERNLKFYKKKIQIVHSDAIRLKQILDNLLTLSELERSKNKPLQKVRIDEVFWDVLEQLSKKYNPEKFQLDFKIPQESFDYLTYPANTTLLYIAVYNFLDNAAKFSSSHQVVNITFFIYQNNLKIVIEDKGIGIPQEELKLLEQPFYRAKNAAAHKGNGLGFSIAVKILKLYHIEFTINSEPGKGTAVSLFFYD